MTLKLQTFNDLRALRKDNKRQALKSAKNLAWERCTYGIDGDESPQ